MINTVRDEVRSRSSRDCVELSTRVLRQVNTEMTAIIERLQATLRKEQEEAAAAAGSDSGALSEGTSPPAAALDRLAARAQT